jgi:deazaflavin-dependent oxidoreductase (nitroreductase family)
MAQTTARPYTAVEERIGSIAIRFMSRANKLLYRLSGGRVFGRWMRGGAIGILGHRGRKSGQQFSSPLVYMPDGERIIVIASKGGMSKHPLWYLNLRANPDCEFEIGSTKRAYRARTASPDEKRAYWPRILAMNPDFDAYQARTTRDIPVVILEPRGVRA